MNLSLFLQDVFYLKIPQYHISFQLTFVNILTVSNNNVRVFNMGADILTKPIYFIVKLLCNFQGKNNSFIKVSEKIIIFI